MRLHLCVAGVSGRRWATSNLNACDIFIRAQMLPCHISDANTSNMSSGKFRNEVRHQSILAALATGFA